MRIYIAHSREYDYKEQLYNPIRNDENIKEYEIILPHEKSDISSNTREFYRTIDLMIAECSYPSVGLGIELGWASDDKIPIYCIYKSDKKISGSIKSITDNIYQYQNVNDMLTIIKKIIEKEKGSLSNSVGRQ